MNTHEYMMLLRAHDDTGFRTTSDGRRIGNGRITPTAPRNEAGLAATVNATADNAVPPHDTLVQGKPRKPRKPRHAKVRILGTNAKVRPGKASNFVKAFSAECTDPRDNRAPRLPYAHKDLVPTQKRRPRAKGEKLVGRYQA